MSDDKLTPAEHALRIGDHLSRVAATYRFRSFGPLWNDPANSSLRLRRPNPHIMAAGESVHVPELIYQECDRPTEARHRFRAEVHPLELELRVASYFGTPADAPKEVVLDGKAVPFKTGAHGAVRMAVEAITDRCILKYEGYEVTTRLGHLQPADTTDGIRARLENLGYRPGDGGEGEALAYRSAIEEFQCDQGMVVDGMVGPDTRARLVKVHGC